MHDLNTVSYRTHVLSRQSKLHPEKEEEKKVVCSAGILFCHVKLLIFAEELNCKD
jgi:hypothetical protein